MSKRIFLPIAFLALMCASWQDRSTSRTYKIAVISDLNSSYGATSYHPDVYATLKELDSIKPDLILCGGDMVAGQKATLSDVQLQDMWESFDKNVLKPIQQMNIPFGFTLGNHDASPNFEKDRNVAKQFWLRQQQHLGLKYVDQSHFPFYFSYKLGDVFIMSWDAAGANVNSDVFTWMAKQLQSKTAKKATLRILLGHLPIYAVVVSKNKPGEVLSNTEKTAEFFKKNGIDLYISGHQHAYFPARNEHLRILNSGCIGEGPRQLIGSELAATKAYTIIEIPKEKARNFSYQTFVPGKKQTISLSDLPDSVNAFNGISLKDVK